MPQIYDMGPTALLPLRRKACWGFFRPKNPTASAGCEPANLGTKGQHTAPRPPKLLFLLLALHLNFWWCWGSDSNGTKNPIFSVPHFMCHTILRTSGWVARQIRGIKVLYFSRLCVFSTLFHKFVPYFPSCDYRIFLVVVVVVVVAAVMVVKHFYMLSGTILSAPFVRICTDICQKLIYKNCFMKCQ